MLPQKFYPPIGLDNSYYIWELRAILGVSIRTIYRLLKNYKITSSYEHLGRKTNRKVSLISLLPIAQSKCFKKYVKRIKENEVKDNENTQQEDPGYYQNLPASKLHLMLKTPIQLVQRKLINLKPVELEDAVRAGLIPTVIVKNTLYVAPWYYIELQHRR